MEGVGVGGRGSWEVVDNTLLCMSRFNKSKHICFPYLVFYYCLFLKIPSFFRIYSSLPFSIIHFTLVGSPLAHLESRLRKKVL